ncbi:hypothetical protein GOP47_0016627 [Adiantum capillus-veneris]|uniref:non-specific serine/threonine protein kinase n=1 Tax=Adiantum capillus-veneris TaxID=13818 RepID=A0A9D4UIF8_ADICA|nr:hypothetical protein GOP47_0016627 [Adiantum capillus-veneris]
MLGLILRSFEVDANHAGPPKTSLSDIADASSARSSTSGYFGGSGGGGGCALSSSRNSDITSSGSTTRRSSCDTAAATSFTHLGPLKISTSKHQKDQDLAWHAINRLRLEGEDISISSLKVLCKLGQGDSGSVYLTRLTGTSCLFALKVVDKEKLLKKNKIHRLHTEREILELVNHPFLPTLYAHFEMGKYSCLLMEYCPGGDLHALIHHQSRNCLGLKIVRYYAAQLVVALEYLHLQGIIYRDLKPENVLLRENGNIMLSDFDLCMHRHESMPARVIKLPIASISSPSKRRLIQRQLRSKSSSTNIGKPIWIHSIWSYLKSSWVKGQHSPRKSRQGITKKRRPSMMYTEVMVEPLHLRTLSMVGTHEYLAPEVLGGLGHGSAVDWWMLGVLIYELLYGTTPFKGQSNKHTLHNIRMRKLRFPLNTEVLQVDNACKSLVQGLLTKDPSKRLGSSRGACEIKQHTFFKGLNWALIGEMRPPLLGSSLNIQHKNFTTQDFEYF